MEKYNEDQLKVLKSIEDEFNKLADTWQAYCVGIEELDLWFSCREYADIMNYCAHYSNEIIVPIILKRFKRRFGMWFDLLTILLSYTPVESENREDLKKSWEIWIKWAEDEKII